MCTKSGSNSRFIIEFCNMFTTIEKRGNFETHEVTGRWPFPLQIHNSHDDCSNLQGKEKRNCEGQHDKRTTNANNQTYVHYTHTFYYIHTNICLCNSYYALNECELSIINAACKSLHIVHAIFLEAWLMLIFKEFCCN